MLIEQSVSLKEQSTTLIGMSCTLLSDSISEGIVYESSVGAFPKAPRKGMLCMLRELHTKYKLYQPITTHLSH